MKDTRKGNRELGWIGLALSTILACIWAFWGIIENFHEGWYYESLWMNLGLMFTQYLSPMLIFITMTLVSIFWPRIGGGLHVKDRDWRKSVWRDEWARHDPVDEHWHLGPIGVLPSHQGSGIGSLLMERFCREVDACSAKAYLETEGEKNRRFYNKFGFETIARSLIFNVENLYMERVTQT